MYNNNNNISNNKLKRSRDIFEDINNNNNINNNNINNNNINNNIRDNNILFSLIWNNVFIKSTIFKHLKLFNLNFGKRKYKSIKELESNKYKGYLNDVELEFEITEEILLDQVIPFNIESLEISYSSSYNTINIPNWLKSVHIKDYTSLPIGFENLKNLETLVLKCSERNQKLYPIKEISKDRLPSSLVQLCLYSYPFKIRKDITLPTNLKRLYVDYDCISIEKGSLPSTLQELHIDKSHFNDILELKEGYLPNSLTKLILKCIGSSEYTIPNDFKFPPNLVYLDMDITEYNYNVKLPSTLQVLCLNITKKVGPLTQDMIPRNLKSLEIKCSSFIDSNGISVLPSTIEKLVILGGYNQKLIPNLFPNNLLHLEFRENFNNGINNNNDNNDNSSPLIQDISNSNLLFPSSLQLLNLGNHFNQDIGAYVLPLGLKQFIVGRSFNKSISDENILPSNLELFKIGNKNYNQFPIKLKNKYTMVDCLYYLKQYELCPQDLRVFKLLRYFNESLKELSLQTNINLEYLDLNNLNYNQKLIVGQDLPENNIIKTLKLGIQFNQVINLKDFKNLENLYIYKSNLKLIIDDNNIDSINNNNNNNSNNNIINYNQQQQPHNFYNLKSIYVNVSNSQFLDSLDPIFYSYIRLIKG